MDAITFAVQLLNGVQYGLVLFLVASGLTLVFGILGVINLAHGSFYMLGAYVGYWLPPPPRGVLRGPPAGGVLALPRADPNPGRDPASPLRQGRALRCAAGFPGGNHPAHRQPVVSGVPARDL